MKRREFVKKSALATAGTMLVPYFLKPFDSYGKASLAGNNKILVVIQLSGGNDGLNTVIPFGNDLYYRSRSSIAIDNTEIIKLNDMQGLNPAMEALHDIYDQGLMSIINNVGYPNPDRSHFRSMDIWHTASDSKEILGSGWIGRYLDSDCEACRVPYNALEVDDSLSLALKGETRNGIAFKNPQQLFRNSNDPFFVKVNKLSTANEHSELGYLYKTLADTQSSAKYIFEKSKVYKATVEYPHDAFGNNLKQVAELICSGIETSVYYVSLTGFDTHVGQNGRQNRLLKQYADGVSAFVKELKKNNRLDDVMVMTFSEFGRRVAQNASNGTDHGTANCMLLFGGGLKKKGIYNAPPDLSDLDDGDLKYKVDFKNVYATVLERWLHADVSKIMNKKVEILDFV